MLLIAQIVLLSCTADDETDSSESDAVIVTFTIAMDKSLATRTYWGEDVKKEAEHEWENTIEYGQLQVLFYDDDNKFIGQLSDVTYLSLDASAAEEYSVVGKLKVDGVAEGSTLSGKVVLLANYDEAVANPAKGDAMSRISSNAFAYDSTAIKNKTKYIPMWGIQTYSFTVRNGMASDIGTIDMLRAMAKIRLKLNSDAYIDNEIVDQTYTLSNVYLDHYCTTGYTVPAGFDDKSMYDGNEFATKNLKTTTSFRGGQTTEDQLYFVQETDGKSYIVYMPEYPTGGSVPQIHFTLTKRADAKQTKDFIVQLKNYNESDGKPTGEGLEILRNTIYEYTVRRVINTSEVELTLLYQVQMWSNRSADITFN